MTVLLANNVSSALAAPITASATSMTVTNGSRFPVLTPGQYFYATIIATNGIVEIVKVNTRNGNAMSITRAQDGTNAQAFVAGARVEMRINAASVRDTVTDQTGPLDTRLTTAEGDITALEGRMTTAEGDITSLEGRMTTAEGDITTIEGDIVALEAFDTTLGTSAGSNSVGFLQAGTGATARTTQGKLRDFVSVKDFGAIGNGVDDDTTEIQTALVAATGKTLYFPAGTYLITSSLTVGSGTLLVGDGKTASALKLQSTTTGTSLLKNTTPASFNISNMQLQSAGNRNDGYALNGIEIVGTAIFQINDLVVNGFSGKGIFIKNIVDAKINNCVVTNCGTGVFCGPNGPAPSVVFHIRGCYISGCVNYGLYNNSTATLVEACIMELNGVSGTDAAVYSACNRGVYVNTYFESNYRNWVRQDDATIWVSTIPVNSNQPSTISWSSGSPPNERGYADLTYSELAIRNIKPDKFWGSVTFGDNLTAINGQSVRFGKNATKTITVGALAAPNTFETIYTFPASGNYGAITGSGQFRSAYLVYVTIGASDLTQESILCSICNNTLTQIGSSSSNIQLSGNNLQVRSASGTDYGRAVYATINQINTFDDFAGI